MPFRRFKLRQQIMRGVQSGLVFLVILLLGATIIGWQTVSDMNADNQARLQHARDMFDRTLDNAYQAAMTVKPLLGQPCANVKQILRHQVATVPDVRTVNLTRGNRIYCTSLYGEYDQDYDHSGYVQGQLDLAPGNSLTPDRALIVYRAQGEEGSVLVGVDGYYLANTLQLMSREVPMMLLVGQRWMGPNGRVLEGEPHLDGGKFSLASQRYAYRLGSSITPQQYWQRARDYSNGSMVLFLILALLGAGVAFWVLGRPVSPEEELARGLAKGEFIPYLQPVMDGVHEACTGCEVLMRWQHPQQGMISPDRFIPMAEASGLIIPMTSDLMRQVRERFAPKARELPVGFHFAFNICARHCQDLSLVEDCRAFLKAFEANPIKLVLELTERELIEPNAMTDSLFAELHNLGVFIAIDDFGTGHSSLTYLQKFQVDFLKIDQSFVAMIGSDALSSHIVDNVIDLATRLGLMLVAEGVETRIQADYLKAHGVDFLQGYLFSRPLPMVGFEQVMTTFGKDGGQASSM
jgi:c-di-GMP phosphodiesterase